MTTVKQVFFQFDVFFSCSPSSLCCLCFYLPPPQLGKVLELHAVWGGEAFWTGLRERGDGTNPRGGLQLQERGFRCGVT